ncbi:CDP-diacylglycerol--inositol 3-phosphatidyltransferase [Cimex lectularius]|uniref:CDP-diacylglycerol--inositol 3-phosphatidyltransferase n=1 Tax=Cimex lectularius TaxID=79782 RepID=A0A8I6RWA5_CIMLE|nr:CDP-diacylglycerol--inositol 3-phosphatidyltransferase [Cimex lectularius]
MAEENIFLFYPNLIGYVRVLLAIVSFYFMPTNYPVASVCYVVSGFLDAFDGHAARAFDQSTKFGAMLDQLTDRCGTAGLLVTLSHFYPDYMFLFQVSIAIDIWCHWIFLHSSLLKGKSSHKFHDLNDNPIMAFYYTKPVLFFMCMGNEAFYASLYLLHFVEGPLLFGIGLFRMVAYISLPVCVIKTLFSLIHGYVAAINIASVDRVERLAMKKQS